MTVHRIPELGWANFPDTNYPRFAPKINELEPCRGWGEGAEDPEQKERPHHNPLINSALPLPRCVSYSRISPSLSLAFWLLHCLNWATDPVSAPRMPCPSHAIQPAQSQWLSPSSLGGGKIVCIIHAYTCVHNYYLHRQILY